MTQWEYAVIIEDGGVPEGSERYRLVVGSAPKRVDDSPGKTVLERAVAAGKEGWELVAVQGATWYFKRPVED